MEALAAQQETVSEREQEVSGLAHVATVSFLASRAAPSLGFWVALAGGSALARVGERRGVRWGYGASIAAMLQTVAMIGPMRFTVPLTQALTAPLLGALEARGWSAAGQMLVCGTIRLLQNAAVLAFAILVLTGVDAYTDFYDSIASWIPLLPEGGDAALVMAIAGLVGWAVFASIVQVLVYRRGLHSWPTGEDPLHVHVEDDVAGQEEGSRGRYDPRAVALAAAIAFGLLISSTSWALLGAVAVWLALAAITCGGDREVVPVGMSLAVMFAGGVFVVTLIGGLGLEEALARAARAALLVGVATWLRAAAGAPGLREVSQRVLGRLRRIPSAAEAAHVMGELGAGRQLMAAARAVPEALRNVPAQPVPVLDAVLGWVAAESRRFRPGAPEKPPVLRARVQDIVLVALAVTPLAALLG